MVNLNRRHVVGGAAALFGLAEAFSQMAEAEPVTSMDFPSPDGKVIASVFIRHGILQYAIALDGKPVLAPSSLAIQCDGKTYGQAEPIGKPKLRTINETYKYLGGKAEAVNQALLAEIPLSAGDEAYFLDVHVANDGVGVRLRLPAKTGRRVEADLSGWSLPGDPVVWAARYDPGYEQTYRQATLSTLEATAYALPVTAKVADVFVTLSEAALVHYSDLAVRPQSGGLAGFLPNDWKGWTTNDEVVQPWRVTILARNLTDLVNTTLIQNLNPAPEASLVDADWIRPGKSAWQWMAVGAPEYEDQTLWVDRTQALGFEYYLVDEGWSEWDNAWASLEAVCKYAKTKGVSIWLWAHSREVADPDVRRAYFRKAVEIGIVGVKIDFPEPANHWWSSWYRDTLQSAADFKLLIDFHGAVKPTGLERTWPNELSREAIRGHEYHITRYNRILEPQHDVILPFTRYVIGHADYTPTVFETKELQGNTWAHELAQAIVFTSPFLCMGGNPADYIANPARDVISALPAVWDETLVLPGSAPGKVAGLARRKGTDWFVGILNGADETAFEIALDFLGQGQWTATRLGEVKGVPNAWDRQDEQVTSADVFRVSMASRGGFVAWIRT